MNPAQTHPGFSVTDGRPLLLWGMGVTNFAVAEACLERDLEVIVGDDNPSDAMLAELEKLSLELTRAEREDSIRDLLRACQAVVPTPGLPDRHPLIQIAHATRTPLLSEFALAAEWDSRPLLAVTGTNGKTTVTTIAAEALRRSFAAELAGNNDVPLVRAISKQKPQLFVVEASSFRLEHAGRFAPRVAAWLNFSPDHLDVHTSLTAYLAAKAAIWRNHGAGSTAIGCEEDVTVADRLPAKGRAVTFGGPRSDFAVRGDAIYAHGELLAEASELPRNFPHDLLNASAAAACALESGASIAETRSALRAFRGLPHRLQLVAETPEGAWYNDSKATTPEAVLSAAKAFDSLVLIAGGRNKGLDLSPLRTLENVSAVIAIGEAAPEICSLFAGQKPTQSASSMSEAVELAGRLSAPREPVLLSPGCTSFDWYGSYAERGDDFTQAVKAALNSGNPSQNKDAHQESPAE